MPETNKPGNAGRMVAWVMPRIWMILGLMLGIAAAFVGVFLISWGLGMMSHTQASASQVFSLPVFWALLVLSLWFVIFGVFFVLLLRKRRMVWNALYAVSGFVSVIGLS